MQNFIKSQTRLAFIQFIFQSEFSNTNTNAGVEDFEKYFISNKKNNFNFMTGSLDTTNFGKKLLGGGIHPFDKTARPQKVKKKINKEYYELIKEFKKISGVGALLNTSFNIHGEPIVFSPKDAFKSFMSSGLKYLYIGDYLIKKI